MKTILKIAVVVFVMFFVVSCNKTYQIHASSETISQFIDVQDMDIQQITRNGEPIPFSEWKEALESRDYEIIPVASSELRKRLEEAELR